MLPGYLTDEVKLSRAITVTAGAAGSTDVAGAGLSMEGFRNVCAIVQLGAIVANAVCTLKWQQSDDDGSADDYTDLEGTLITVADDQDEKVVYMDLQRPTKKYVRIYNDRATQNSTLTAVYAQYNPTSLGVSQGSNVSGEQHSSPAEGTA